MSILIYNKEDQASGSFNSGEILEKKPIGFPQDGALRHHISMKIYQANIQATGQVLQSIWYDVKINIVLIVFRTDQ